MEDKKLTPQESMALITKMIEDSKQRIATPDTRVSVMWATLSIVTAVIVGILCLITHDPRYNYMACNPYNWLSFEFFNGTEEG